MGFIKRNNAMFFLLFNAIMWGSSYVWSKMLLAFLPRFSILLLCSLGGMLSTCVIFHRSIKKIRMHEIPPCLVVSGFSVLSNIFFMLALQNTSSSNTAFIVQLSVILTPVIMALLNGKMPQGKVFFCAFLAVGGVFFITFDFQSFRLNTGDLLALCNALLFSCFLAGQNRIAGKVTVIHFSIIHYTFNFLVFVSLSALFEFRSISLPGLASPLFVGLAAINILVSVITVLFQGAAIKYVIPEKAILIYTLEPVTTLILAWAFMGEQQDGLKSAVGCLLILCAIVLSVAKRPVKFHKTEERLLNN